MPNTGTTDADQLSAGPAADSFACWETVSRVQAPLHREATRSALDTVSQHAIIRERGSRKNQARLVSIAPRSKAGSARRSRPNLPTCI